MAISHTLLRDAQASVAVTPGDAGADVVLGNAVGRSGFGRSGALFLRWAETR